MKCYCDDMLKDSLLRWAGNGYMTAKVETSFAEGYDMCHVCFDNKHPYYDPDTIDNGQHAFSPLVRFCASLKKPLSFLLLSLIVITTIKAPAKTDSTIAGINKESCFIHSIREHQKAILHKYAYQKEPFSQTDLVYIQMAKAVLISEQKRMAKLEKRYTRLTGEELTWEKCK
jgi:hypothetical protein